MSESFLEMVENGTLPEARCSGGKSQLPSVAEQAAAMALALATSPYGGNVYEAQIDHIKADGSQTFIIAPAQREATE